MRIYEINFWCIFGRQRYLKKAVRSGFEHFQLLILLFFAEFKQQYNIYPKLNNMTILGNFTHILIYG